MVFIGFTTRQRDYIIITVSFTGGRDLCVRDYIIGQASNVRRPANELGNMAESSCEGYMHCICFNRVWKYLGDTLFSDEAVMKQISDTKEEEVDFSAEPISVMYTGGTIRPVVDGAIDKVDAIGFHGGRVVALGSKSDVIAEMDNLGTKYTTVELSDGQTLLPGLIEPHLHIVPTAMMMGWHDFGPFDGQYLRDPYNLEWLTREIKSVADKLKLKGAWILGCNVDPSLMPFTVSQHKGELNILQNLNCDTLDKIENEVPLMMMSASGHTAYVNTLALHKIYDSSEEVREEYSSFDKYKAHVMLKGGLQEISGIKPAILAAKWQIIWMIRGIIKDFDSLFETANQRGVTLMYDAAMSRLLKVVLDFYFLLRKPRVRIGYAELCESAKAAEEMAPYEPPPTEFKNIYQGSVKLISDGSNQGLTGYQTESYCCKPPDNKGLFNFPTLEYMSMVKTIADKGWPMMIHANGNKAIDLAVKAYREALGGKSGLTKRHRIEHCSLLNEENLDSMRDLGISPSFLIGHVGYWGYVFKTAIFEEKAEQLDLCKSALDRCMRITLHSDNFVTPLGPLRMMEQAITRIDSKGNVLNEKEKISAEQALRAVTYDAAWQCHADQWVGSLEAHKMADYVILEEDPITRKDPVGMRDIPVLETWLGGVKVYQKEVTPT